MSEKKRITIMLCILGALALGNYFVHFSGKNLSGRSLFGNSDDLSFSPRHEQIAEQLGRTPSLSFSTTKTKQTTNAQKGRNPFVFGIDKRQEEARQQRMEDMRKAREENEILTQQAKEEHQEAEKVRFEGKIIGVITDSVQRTKQISVSMDKYIHVLRVGDHLLERFRLDAIEEEHALFTHLESGDEVEVKIDTIR